jgi:hypothetical protein
VHCPCLPNPHPVPGELAVAASNANPASASPQERFMTVVGSVDVKSNLAMSNQMFTHFAVLAAGEQLFVEYGIASQHMRDCWIRRKK